MSRRYYVAVAACLLAFVNLDLSRPAMAQILGDRTEATNCASAVGGSVKNSTVRVVCGIPHEQVAELMRLAVSGRPDDYTELLRRLDAMIPANSRLRTEALARFFTILDEAEAQPQDLEKRLVEIASQYHALLARLETTSSSDPKIQQLKERAREALQGGDFAAAERLLNEVKDAAIGAARRLKEEQATQLLAAAEAAAENGALALTRLRYREAADYFAEAVDLLPEGSDRVRADYLNQQGEPATTAWRSRCFVGTSTSDSVSMRPTTLRWLMGSTRWL